MSNMYLYGMTPEEAHDNYITEKAYAEGYEAAKKEFERPQWIPCSERLPEKDGEYLAQRSGDLWVNMCVAYFNHHGGNYWVDNDGFILRGICAWMPLPKPYEKEGE